MPATKIPLSSGGVVPRDLDARQWDRWAREQSTHFIRSGQTAYDTGNGVWFGDDNGTIKFSVGNSAGNKVTWNGTDLTIAGNLVLGSANHVRSGQTAYDTGTGFWLGNDGGTPKVSIGNSAGNKLTWNGSSLSITGSLSFTNAVQTFTPTWSGFSSAPSGDLNYIDFGAYVVLWTRTALTGTSNATSMAITNLPSAIEPASGFQVLLCKVVNNPGVIYNGSVALQAGTNTLSFAMDEVSGSNITSNSLGFTNSGSKGLAAGWIIIYAK